MSEPVQCHPLMHDITVVDGSGWLIEVDQYQLTLRFFIPQHPEPWFTVRMPREAAEQFIRLLPAPGVQRPAPVPPGIVEQVLRVHGYPEMGRRVEAALAQAAQRGAPWCRACGCPVH